MNTQPEESSGSELYLIAHKVRGQPAFDIATRLQIGDEEGWIIPTSGHRAYPYWDIPMSWLRDFEGVGFPDIELPTMPPDWPDHYATTAAPRLRLADALGLTKPKPKEPIRRI